MTSALLQVEHLDCFRQQKQIFKPVSFALTAGEVLLIEGANGAGKSSLLRILAGVATPANGQLHWHGAGVYTDHIHYIGHQHGIRLGLTVAENCSMFSQLFDLPLLRLTETLQLLALDSFTHTQTQFLSAGQVRKTALAKLFLFPKPLWILDEPLTSLDIGMQEILLAKITDHVSAGGMCILTSHQPISLTVKTQRLRLAC